MIFSVSDLAYSGPHTTGEYLLNSTTYANVLVVESADLPPVSNITDDVQALVKMPHMNQNQKEISEPEEWTPKMEAKFFRLAERKALNGITLEERVEFEKLSALRRQLKNPRAGEEVLAEYKQRMLTKKLVEALTEYVNFHQQYSPSH